MHLVPKGSFPRSVYRAWAFRPDVGLVIAGGYNRKDGLLDAAEMSEDLGVSFKALQLLPRAVHGTCLVLSDGKAIIIGGFDGKLAILHLTNENQCAGAFMA